MKYIFMMYVYVISVKNKIIDNNKANTFIFLAQSA